MSLSHKIKTLREKPEHVRERILIVSLAIIAPILIVCGVCAFMYERSHTISQQVIDLKDLGNYFSGTVQDIKGPADTFKSGEQTATDAVSGQ